MSVDEIFVCKETKRFCYFINLPAITKPFLINFGEAGWLLCLRLSPFFLIIVITFGLFPRSTRIYQEGKDF